MLWLLEDGRLCWAGKVSKPKERWFELLMDCLVEEGALA